MSQSTHNRRPRWATIALTVLPLWLIVSAVAAVWLAIRSDERKQQEQQQRFVAGMSVERIGDDLHKFTEIIGERHSGNPEATQNLKRAAAMIEGVLGPSNTGYTVERFAGPDDCPILRVILPGQSKSAAPIWVVAGYDSQQGPDNWARDASGVAATIAAAQAMAGDKLPAPVHFIFIPYFHHLNSPLAESQGVLVNLQPKPSTVFCIDTVGHGSEMVAASTDPESPALQAASGLGVRYDSTRPDTPMLAGARAAGFRAIQVTTDLQLSITAKASPELTAAAAGRLVEWLRRSARLHQAP